VLYCTVVCVLICLLPTRAAQYGVTKLIQRPRLVLSSASSTLYATSLPMKYFAFAFASRPSSKSSKRNRRVVRLWRACNAGAGPAPLFLFLARALATVVSDLAQKRPRHPLSSVAGPLPRPLQTQKESAEGRGTLEAKCHL